MCSLLRLWVNPVLAVKSFGCVCLALPPSRWGLEIWTHSCSPGCRDPLVPMENAAVLEGGFYGTLHPTEGAPPFPQCCPPQSPPQNSRNSPAPGTAAPLGPFPSLLASKAAIEACPLVTLDAGTSWPHFFVTKTQYVFTLQMKLGASIGINLGVRVRCMFSST